MPAPVLDLPFHTVWAIIRWADISFLVSSLQSSDSRRQEEMESARTCSQPEPEPAAPPSAAGGRDWSELPLDALVQVFARLGPVEILMGSGLACRSWLRAAREPELWRFVDMVSHRVVEEMDGDVLRAIAEVAVDRAGGKMEAFSGKYFVTDDLLKYIGDRCLYFLLPFSTK